MSARKKSAKPRPKNAPKAKVGESSLKVNATLIGKLALHGLSNVEIADICGRDESTIRKGFPEILAKSRAVRKLKLRKAQWKSAMQGNVSMLIFLGKAELKQSETGANEQAAVPEIKWEITVRPPEKKA